MTEKTTLVIGASFKPNRFSNIAVRNLVLHRYPVIAVGLREGIIHGVSIRKPFPVLKNVHTVTLYIGSKNQSEYYDYILNIHPKRVIFNPGTENVKFEETLRMHGIEVVTGCTLIMLSDGTY
jgi:uncharacterized protein